MKILVTGGSGFVGANLCQRLINDGHQVFCIDNFYSSEKKNVGDLKNLDGFTFIEHDIVEQWPSVVADIDFDQIYHLACPASPPKYQKDHIYTLRVCFEGTRNVFELARSIGERCGKAPRVLFTSTSEVYGDPEEHPQKESYRGNVNPHGVRSCYDEGKRVSESLCMNYWREFGVAVRIVRIFNTYGPKMDPEDGRVVSNFIMQALGDEKLTVYGNGKQTRSFQYIDDLVEGMVRYMGLEDDFPGPINIGNPDEFSLMELISVLEDILGHKLEVVYKNLPEDDPVKRRPDISLANKKLKWQPKIDLKEGLKKTVEYFRAMNKK